MLSGRTTLNSSSVRARASARDTAIVRSPSVRVCCADMCTSLSWQESNYVVAPNSQSTACRALESTGESRVESRKLRVRPLLTFDFRLSTFDFRAAGSLYGHDSRKQLGDRISRRVVPARDGDVPAPGLELASPARRNSSASGAQRFRQDDNFKAHQRTSETHAGTGSGRGTRHRGCRSHSTAPPHRLRDTGSGTVP